jgi:hypothetical protein
MSSGPTTLNAVALPHQGQLVLLVLIWPPQRRHWVWLMVGG